jgi:cytochrome c biogenesis protein CcmG, thiol:disulfide interchange protein DsbE
MIRRISFIIFLFLVVILYSYYQKSVLNNQISLKSELILKKMPQGVFSTLEGEVFNPLNLKSQLIIVHFWGTWCAPCEAELPELLSLIKQFEAKSEVSFLLVAVNDEVTAIKKHLRSLGVFSDKIIWLVDNKNVYRDAYGTTRVPETHVFSSDKSTLKRYVGPQEWSKPMFYQAFSDFLQMSSHQL